MRWQFFRRRVGRAMILVALLTWTTSVPAMQESATNANAAKATADASPSPDFELPVRVKAGGEFVSVEAPGYACPTMADVDGDGKLDLIVGQFRNGHLQFCRNVSEHSDRPEFAKPEWLMTGESRAVVPGVW